jgi:dolichol-phosphate mannosyltransferase
MDPVSPIDEHADGTAAARAGDFDTVSVVMPVYNEAAGLAVVVEEVVREILDRVPGSELVVVDDCSTDASAAIVEGLAATDSRIRLLRNARNSGHGPTIRHGMDDARSPWIFHLDSDGQVDVAEFIGMWERRAGCDLVLGIRARRNDPAHRLVLTRCVRAMVSVLARRRVPDANVPFKLIRRDLYRHLQPVVPPEVFAPSILIVLGALRSGARVTEVEITHLPRRHGTSTLHLRRLAAVVLRCVRETVVFGMHRVPPYVPPVRAAPTATHG